MIHDLDISGIQICVVLLDNESRPAEVSAQGGRNTELAVEENVVIITSEDK